MKAKKLSLVIPCYNEEDMLPISIPQILSLLNGLIEKQLISNDSEVCFIDDGSHDKTWQIIQENHQKYAQVKGIKLSTNFGHQNALLAGLMSVQTDITISIDADLQDDLNVIEDMINLYYQGYDIVYGVRSDRDSDSFFKRFFAQSYYKFLRILGVNIIPDHADFRLMSQRSLATLADYKEVNLFLRGIIPIIGYKTAKVYYSRLKREAGVTKYNIPKMLGLALNGITSFSVIPLYLIIWLGFIVSLISGFMGIWALATKFILGNALPGWSSIVVPMYFLGGIQLLTLGIIGIYISKVYLEVKARPRYILEDTVGLKQYVKLYEKIRSVHGC